MKTIYMYPLVLGENCFTVPGTNAEVLSVQWTNGGVMAWVLFDKHDSIVNSVVVHGYGTGCEIDPNYPLRHISTVVDPGGYVWHYFRLQNGWDLL